ncbi:MAG: nuclear transport factor 2 family protein [Sphingomonadales bacterium]|nr:nuclear transport factor 2 family protein [Sphingomonadales bacterium]
MDTAERLLARAAIADCIHRYALAIRRGDADAAAALFTADGCFETRECDPRAWPGHRHASRCEGRDAVRGKVADSIAAVRMLPMIHNLIVDVDETGDRATATSLMVGRVWPTDREIPGEYADTLVREDGDWRFVERIYTMYKLEN